MGSRKDIYISRRLCHLLASTEKHAGFQVEREEPQATSFDQVRLKGSLTCG